MELHIASPLLGPFAEPNGLSGKKDLGADLGVAVFWSSPSGAFRSNLLECEGSYGFRKKIVIEQAPDEDFDLVLDELFERSSRLFEFFEELGPFVYFGHYSLNCARAKDWLHPELVFRGFSLGQSRAHRDGVTTPLLWVVRTADQHRSLGVPCVCAGYLDWTPAGVGVRLDSGWGLGWFCLSQYLGRFSESDCFQWLTQSGLERMSSLYAKGNTRRAEKEARARKPERFSVSDKVHLASLRRAMNASESQADDAQHHTVQLLGERAYSALLSSLIKRHTDSSCAIVVSWRRPRQPDEHKLLRLIVRNGMRLTAQAFVRGASLVFDPNSPTKPAVLSIVIESGDLEMLQTLLDSAGEIGADHLHWAFDEALGKDDETMLRLLATHPKLSTVRQAAMLESFRRQYYVQNWPVAVRLLDLGLRPLQACKTRDFFAPDFLA